MILIHAAGNEKIGLGNLTRSFEIGKYISRNISEKLVVIFECSREIGRKYFIENSNMYISNTREESKNIIRNLYKYMFKNSNIVISDLVDMTYEDNAFYKENGFNKLIQLSDNNVEKVIPDMYINSDAFVRNFNLSPLIKVVNGSKYIIIKEELKKNRSNKFIPIDKIINILICFGGADPAGYTEECINEILQDRKYNKYNFDIILGAAFSLNRVKNILNYKKSNISYIINEQDIGNRILKNDLVITLGGITTYEALFLGRPVAAMGWSYMDYYVDKLSQSELIYKLGNNKKEFKNLYYCMNDVEKLNNIALNGFKTINGEGVKNIVKFILENR